MYKRLLKRGSSDLVKDGIPVNSIGIATETFAFGVSLQVAPRLFDAAHSCWVQSNITDRQRFQGLCGCRCLRSPLCAMATPLLEVLV